MTYEISETIGYKYDIIKGQCKHKNCDSPVFTDKFVKLMTENKIPAFISYEDRLKQIKQTLCDKHKNDAVCDDWSCNRCKYDCCNLCLIECSNVMCGDVNCGTFMNKCKICAKYYCNFCYHDPLNHKFSCFEYVKCYICDQLIVEHETKQKYEWISVLDHNITCGKLIDDEEGKYQKTTRENKKITIYHPGKIRSISESCEKHMIILHQTCELKNKHVTIISETDCDALGNLGDGLKYKYCEVCWIQDKLCKIHNYPVKKCAKLKEPPKDKECEPNVIIKEI